MGNKYLYEKFNEDKRIYNLNQGYWKRQFKAKIEQKFSEENILFKNTDKRGNKIYDANPIFTFLNHEKTRAIRIIQDEIPSEEIDDNDISAYLISAWIDKIRLYESFQGQETIVKELVIALYLTRETVDKSMILIKKWLAENLEREEIDQILNTNR